MANIIVTAFEPFATNKKNPTEALLERIPDHLYNYRVYKVTLPVVYNHAFDRLLPLIEKHKPVLILMLGLAYGRSHVNVERIAVNVADSKTKDNLGNIIEEQRIEEDGPDGLFTTLPLEAIMERFRKKKLPVRISNTAGTYVCNNLFYKTLHYLKTYDLDTKAGFVHVPPFPDMVHETDHVPSMSKSVMVDAVMGILDVALNPIDYKKTAQKVQGAKKAK